MNIISLITYCIIVTFSPGPTNIIILSLSSKKGVRKAMDFTIGATIAFGILLTISALLNSFLSERISEFLPVMKYIGAAYILYLTIQVLKSGKTEKSKKTEKSEETEGVEGRLKGTLSNSFLYGFVMQFINPKVVIFTLTVIPGFVAPYVVGNRVSLFVLLITVIGFCAFFTWVIFGSIFKRFLLQYQRAVSIFMAAFLLYSAYLVLSTKGL